MGIQFQRHLGEEAARGRVLFHITTKKNLSSLKGELYDINMPLLYGKGERTFRRLRGELARSTDDHFFLVWTVRSESEYWKTSSVFAKSPPNFFAAAILYAFMRKPVLQVLHPRSASNLIASRIRIFHASMLLPTVSSGRISHIFLDCGKRGRRESTRIFIFLAKDTGADEGTKALWRFAV